MDVQRSRLLVVALSFAFALHPSSQGLYRKVLPAPLPRVWTVDDSGGADFTNLPEAVSAAGSGDVLLVAPGNYTAFTVQSKALTILGDGGVPQVTGTTSIAGLGPGENLVLRGLKIANSGFTADPVPLRVENNHGTVWIEDCALTVGLHQGLAIGLVSAEDSEGIVLVRTTVGGPSPGSLALDHAGDGLHALRSAVHAWESSFLGTTPVSNAAFPTGGNGATLVDSFLYAAGSTIIGGKGRQSVCVGGSCSTRGTGGAGLHAASSGGAPLTLACSFQGGVVQPGSSGPPCGTCPSSLAGPALVGSVVQEDLPLRSYELETPVRSGTSYQLAANCEPGEFVWSVFSQSLAPTYVPNYFGTQVSPLPVTLVFEGVADGTGSLVKTVPIPPLAGLTTFQRLYAQGLFFDGFNNAYLGSPSVLVIVN